MYINGKDRVYMLDRDNSVFCVQNVSFPHRKNLDAHLENTLIDGVDINSYYLILFKSTESLFLRNLWLTKTQ